MGSTSKWTRIDKKRSYAKVTTVLVQAARKNDSITFLGIYPITNKTISKQRSLSINLVDVLFEKSIIPKRLKLQIRPIIKNVIRSNHNEILSYKTNHFAQWVFLEDWVKSGGALDMHVLCSVSKDLDDAERYIICDAEARQKNRIINASYNQYISLA